MSVHGDRQPPNWRRAGHWLARLPTWLAAAALFSLMVMTFLDVTLRSGFNSPIPAGTELTRIFMAIIVFASLPIISARGEHIVVDLFDSFYSPRLARIRDVLVDLLSGVLLLWPALRVFQLAERARSYGDVTEYLRIPQFYIAYFIAAAVFITALAMILRAGLELFGRLGGPSKPEMMQDTHEPL
jgi:TRAP-type C4-dicarboxylate transport system permease small subunit